MFPDRHIVSKGDPILLEKKDLLDFLYRLLPNSKTAVIKVSGTNRPRTARKIRFYLVVLYAMLDPFYKSFYLFLIFYSICLDPTGYIHRIRMKAANGICYIVFRQASCNKEGLCNVLTFEFLPVKSLHFLLQEHQRADNRHWSQEELHLSPLEQHESSVGEALARW